MKIKILFLFFILGLGLLLGVIISENKKPIKQTRYIQPDKLYNIIEANVEKLPGVEVIADIDHSRLAHKANSPMPPSHVLIFSDPVLETDILQLNPMAAMDLPLRLLSYEQSSTQKASVLANSYEYIMQRHNLKKDRSIKKHYESIMSKALKGISPKNIAHLPSTRMKDKGLITLESPFDFDITKQRVLDAINKQDDTVIFGQVNFQERAMKLAVTLPKLELILFGAPAPGGKAMRNAPELGLDAFCQKLLIWKDKEEKVYVTFNDLITLAKYQKASVSIPLRIVNFRVNKTFTKALEDK